MLAESTRAWLLARARKALGDSLGTAGPPMPSRPEDPILDAPGRVFVSWHMGARLVGCIGSLEPRLSLDAAVAHFAVQSGRHDPRTPGATAEEFPDLECEISVLTPASELAEVGLDAIASAIEPRRDGVILRHGSRKAVYLPVVWEKLTEPQVFLLNLCRKAGIDPALHGAEVRAAVFTAETWAG